MVAPESDDTVDIKNSRAELHRGGKYLEKFLEEVGKPGADMRSCGVTRGNGAAAYT